MGSNSPEKTAAEAPVFGHALLPRFQMDPTLTNLNQGSYGVIANDVFAAQAAVLQRVEHDPELWFRVGLDDPTPPSSPAATLSSSSRAPPPEGCTANFQCALTKARGELALFLGVSADDLVFVDNASEVRDTRRAFCTRSGAIPRLGQYWVLPRVSKPSCARV